VDEYISSQPELAASPLQYAQQAPPVQPAPYVRRERRLWLPAILFALTCFSTFYVAGVRVDRSVSPPEAWIDYSAGMTYMLAVMAILLAHELGHFLQAVRYRIPASLPYFIPMPLMPLGTMGAVIGMEGSRANRKQLFDIGLTGPLAGLVVAIPIAWYGIKIAEPYYGPPASLTFSDPLIFQWMTRALHPDLPVNQVYQWNPYYMAGWVGMLITGLNMLPISQLDGGHTAYTLFGRKAHWLARAVVATGVASMVWNQQFQYGAMLLMVMFIGLDHPPTSDDAVPLGRVRTVVGLASLLIPIFCFAPVPISVSGP
jgi:membrane-associated protease RseP (regulator of RpoE activity)